MAESQIHDCNLLCIEVIYNSEHAKRLVLLSALIREDSSYRRQCLLHRLITPQSSESRYLFILRMLGSR